MFAYHRSLVRRFAAFAFLFVGTKSADNSSCFALPVTFAFAFAFSVAITNAASEPASMGRGNFFSWTAVRSRACDRGD
jgi:hypothetical protein